MLPALDTAQASSATRIAAFLVSREWTCNAGSLASYRQCLKSFEGWLEGRPISTLTVGAYLTARKHRKLSIATLSNDYRMLKTCCRWLVEQGMLDRDPFAGAGRVRPPAKKRRRRIVWTEQAIALLLAASEPVAANKRNPQITRQRWSVDGPYAREADQAYALVLLLVDSALRAGEVCALTCAQLRAPELIIRSKGDHEDIAFITEPTRAALLALAEGRPGDAPLFLDWHGRRCTVRALRGIVVRLARRAGVSLPPRPLHAFRHFAAQQWLKSGSKDLTIQQLMRHESLTTTQIYTQLSPEELAQLHAEASPIKRLLARAKERPEKSDLADEV